MWAWAATYLIGIFTGAGLKTWLVTNEAKTEIEKALDTSGIRRAEFLALVRKVESNGERIDRIGR